MSARRRSSWVSLVAKQWRRDTLDMNAVHLLAGTLALSAVLFVARQSARGGECPNGVRSRSLRWRKCFFLCLLVAVLIWRAPIIFFNAELNVDESLMLAQGLKF